MSLHQVDLKWARDTDDFNYETYSRDHTWAFDNGVVVEASAAPGFSGNEARVDPEESFVASLASCHMLTFLAIAARKRWTVDRYEDHAVGVLEKNAEGRLAVTTVTMKPRIEFSGDQHPTPEEIAAVHEKAHKACFIANSVKTEVRVEGA